jgi:hypothetical protein
MPIAHLVPLVGCDQEDVGATVVGVVDALHAGVGDEDSGHLVVGGISEQVVDAAALPGPAGGEEVAVLRNSGSGSSSTSKLCQYPVPGFTDGTSASVVQAGVMTYTSTPANNSSRTVL